MEFLVANSTSEGKLSTPMLMLETFLKSLAVPPLPVHGQ